MTSRRFLPALLLLFVGSGCAALIYEIVWFQLLQLVIGSSAISLGVLLGTFMGGMCLGSFVLSSVVPARHHPLRVYACLELGIALIGLLVLVGMPLVSGVYTSWAGSGVAGLLFRGVIASVCLLPPTLLMGATLPAISRWVEATPEGVSWLGFFYGGNIAGAVVGSVLTGFYLLRVFDVSVATYVAVAINVIVALVGLAIAKATPYEAVEAAPSGVTRAADSTSVYVVIALSGMTALAAEVIWTRLLSLLFGATTYTFSLILAVFLFGLGIGSSVGSAVAPRLARPRVALGWCQVVLCACMAWTAYTLTQSLPYWPINPSATTNPWINLQVDGVRALFAVLPAAILWGASFPLALAAVAARGQDPARLVGGVYAANTVGAIVGSLGASLVLVAWIGTQHAQQVLMVVAAIGGALLLLGPANEKRREVVVADGHGLRRHPGRRAARPERAAAFRPCMVAYGRYANMRVNDSAQYIYVGEGMTASVAVSKLSDGVLNYHNAGKVQASSEPQDMRLQRMLGHMTTLIPPQREARRRHRLRRRRDGRRGVGRSGGHERDDRRNRAARAASRLRVLRRAQLQRRQEPEGPRPDRRCAALRPDVEGEVRRHHVRSARSVGEGRGDALHARVLRGREGASESRRRRDAVRAAVREQHRGGEERNRDVLRGVPERRRLGQHEQRPGIRPRAARPGGRRADPHQRRRDSGEAAIGPSTRRSSSRCATSASIRRSICFRATRGRATDLKEWLKDATINRDRNLRLQYLAGLGLNLYESGPIYSEILRYRKFPEDLFIGQPETIASLRAGIQRGLDYRE